MYVCRCHYKARIDVLNETQSAIVQSAESISLLLQRLLSSCHVDILSIKDVTINTLNRTFLPYEHSDFRCRSYRCPTCSRALINMDHYFRLLDVEVRRQPMPAPYDSWQTVILWYNHSEK